MSELKWWCWTQNNSGGEFIVNDMVAHCVWVQAFSKDDAEEMMLYITDDNDWSCECCGSRWEPEPDDEEGVDEPDLTKSIGYRNAAVLHYATGHFEKVELK